MKLISENDRIKSVPPSPTAVDGRAANGRFAPGNRLAKGNPAARHVQKLRFSMLRGVKPGDLQKIISKLIEQAIAGDVQAAKLLMDRLFGPPLPIDVEERLALLEKAAGRLP